MSNLNVSQLVSKLQDQQSLKLDVVITASDMYYHEGMLHWEDPIAGTRQFKPSKNFVSQICDKLKMPRKYYERILADGSTSLLDRNINHWLQSLDKNYMVRTFYDAANPEKNLARALVSDRYSVIDHLDILTKALDVVRHTEQTTGRQLAIGRCSLTDNNMYLRVHCPSIQAEAKELLKDYRRPDRKEAEQNGQSTHQLLNDYIHVGCTITNNETGNGRFVIAPSAIVNRCLNFMSFKESAYARMHVGSKQETNFDWSVETKKLEHELILSQTHDAFSRFLSSEWLDGTVKQLSDMNQEIEYPLHVIKNMKKELHFSDSILDRLTDHFMRSGDMTTFGVAQALNWDAHSGTEVNKETGNRELANSPDQAFKLECLSASILKNAKQFDFKPKDKDLILA